MKQKNKEALLNEYKGYLFEYLVAKNLCDTFQLPPLEKNLSEKNLKMLTQQESYVRNQFPHLLKQLPLLAKETSSHISGLVETQVQAICLVGKQNSSLAENHFNEGDIEIQGSHVSRFISLKLAKSGLPTNSKSSGVLSFFEKYFGDSETQREFNNYINYYFETLGRELHEMRGIEFDSQFETWKNMGFPVLPGELATEESSLLHEYYSKLAGFIAEKLRGMQKNPDFFKRLLPLMGFSHPNIHQVICFYHGEYQLEEIVSHNSPGDADVEKIEQTKSTVKLFFSWGEVHLRVKPMNVFTSKAYKINIALKFKPLS